jgi:hypothetical protein
VAAPLSEPFSLPAAPSSFPLSAGALVSAVLLPLPFPELDVPVHAVMPIAMQADMITAHANDNIFVFFIIPPY